MKRPSKQPRDPGRVEGRDAATMFFAAGCLERMARMEASSTDRSKLTAYYIETYFTKAAQCRARAREIRDYLRAAKREGGAS